MFDAIPEAKRLPLRLHRDERRVVTRMFDIYSEYRLPALIERVCGLSDDCVAHHLNEVMERFHERHKDLRKTFLRHFDQVVAMYGWQGTLDETRRMLVGSYFTMEYSIEGAALFNPSIVPHPAQNQASNGELRFVMSLRATGEGHVSSVVFRTGEIKSDNELRLDAPPRFQAAALRAPDQYYLKPLFKRKLDEMAINTSVSGRLLESLPEQFTFAQLTGVIAQAQQQPYKPGNYNETIDSIMWLARSNYQIRMDDDADITDIVLFPQSENESRGIEDLRLVKFREDDGACTYYGTYTAYNGYRVLPMLLETGDFKTISVHTLNGACARDKGMALFPRRINGHYVMCSRIDGRNLYIMYSDFVHFWESAELLATPKYPWELNLIGNCGAPIETPEGWLLLTHGVGPMRRYCIGAMLLDLENPARIIGRLAEPLLAPSEEEREGYVPNVVYSCGAITHNNLLYIPYAMADQATSMAVIALDTLLDALKCSPDV